MDARIPYTLSVPDALRVYPWRWKVERLFCDRKEVLNLHRFYPCSPNGVAMQVYAAHKARPGSQRSLETIP